MYDLKYAYSNKASESIVESHYACKLSGKNGESMESIEYNVSYGNMVWTWSGFSTVIWPVFVGSGLVRTGPDLSWLPQPAVVKNPDFMQKYGFLVSAVIRSENLNLKQNTPSGAGISIRTVLPQPQCINNTSRSPLGHDVP